MGVTWGTGFLILVTPDTKCCPARRTFWSARQILYQWIRERLDKGAEERARKIYKPEEIVNLLRQVEVAEAKGKTTPAACKEAGIVEQTYYRWRKEYGGLKVDQARRLKELEQENSRLKRLVSELSLRLWLNDGSCVRLRPEHANHVWS